MITDLDQWRDKNRPAPALKQRSLGSVGAWDRFAAVDVEASGPDPARDDIIEIAVIVFEREGIVEEYSTTIRPLHPVSLDIKRLTGIEDEDLANGIALAEALPEVKRLIGSLPIVGHSVAFDVAYLQTAGLRLPNRQLDTFQLAT